MPTYEYICENEACGHKVEVMQKISDDPLKFCPHCDQETLKKIISQSNFILKGTGWYKTTAKPSSE